MVHLVDVGLRMEGVALLEVPVELPRQHGRHGGLAGAGHAHHDQNDRRRRAPRSASLMAELTVRRIGDRLDLPEDEHVRQDADRQHDAGDQERVAERLGLADDVLR